MIRFATVVLAAMTLATGAQANHCSRSTASGIGVSKEIASSMSNQALKDMIAKNGERGVGKVKTTCDGSAIVTTSCKSSQRTCR